MDEWANKNGFFSHRAKHFDKRILAAWLKHPKIELARYQLAWENSWHCAKPPLVSPRNDVGETSGEIPYWLRVTTQIWVVLLIG